jgi:N-acylglucosamine 2-epimerase
MDQARIDQLIAIYRDGLLNDTLPFWLPRCVDRESGGFMIARDRDGTLLDTDKGVWQQGRFTWLLGELYNHVEPRGQWLEPARRAAKFMDDYCYDPTDGRISVPLKGNLWKGPFHMPRMQLVCRRILEEMKAGLHGEP